MKPYFETELGKLYNGDCLEVMDELIKQGIKIDLLCVDPDYPLTSRGTAGGTGGMLKNSLDGNVFGKKAPSIKEWLPKVKTLLKEKSHIYIMVNEKNLIDYHIELRNQGLNVFKTLVWIKDNKITNMYYMGQKEYIIFARKGKAKKINNCGTSDVFMFPNKKLKDENNKNLHDTPKPVELMEVLIKNSTKEGDVVLDFMCGIGSTLIASNKTNRKYIGVDINEKYCKITKQRLQNEQQTLL